MDTPKRIWWARPRKLCALERPGGGGRSHRPERRRHEIEWLESEGVHTVISTMTSRHNLDADEELEQLLVILRRELRRKGAVAIHGNRYTDFVAAVCAAYLADTYDTT